MRREFVLPEGDVQHLGVAGFPWETVRDGALGRLVVHDFPVPAGFKPDRVSLNLRIEPGYPETQIDMVYFFPALALLDQRAIAQTAGDQFDGKTWQRWSRHRTAQNPWRPGIDGVGTHIALIRFWLRRELDKK
jgi:hypothetical protein